MALITAQIESLIEKALSAAAPEAGSSPIVTFTKDSSLGEIQCNNAMALAKALKQNPRQIAQVLIDAIPENTLIEKTEIAGPGFINIKLKTQAIYQYLAQMDTPAVFDDIETDGEVIIDYSSPNIAKKMHIGHLGSTIIGDSIKRIYGYLGYNTVADNHVGDWGTQFGKLIVAYRQWLNKETYQADPIEELERLYVKFEQESQEQPELVDQAREELKKLQDGDEENTALWKEFIDSSIKEYNCSYDRLGITFDTYRGESFYHPIMPGIVDELKERGIASESEGAIVVFFDEETHLHPCIIQKKDGAYLYATSDLACIRKRMEDYQVNRVVYVVDERQSPHFKQVFNIAAQLGMNVPLIHVAYGIMSFADGHFSSRKGNVIHLSYLLDEAEKRAFAIVSEKNPELPEEERKTIASVVGIGAVKYFSLAQNRTSNVIFDWEKVLSLEGNSAPYLQYVYARIQSVLGKSETDNLSYPTDGTVPDAEETELIHSLLQFPKAVLQAAEHYKPNIITEYVYDLSQRFNRFYHSHPILKAEMGVKQLRLFLCERTASVIRTGLNILGIDVIDRM